MASNLTKRLLVAAVGIPIVVVVAWAGGVVMAIGLGILAAVGVGEISRMLAQRRQPFLYRLAPVVAAALPTLAWTAGPGGTLAALTGVLLTMFVVAVLRVPPETGPFRSVAFSFTAAAYVGGLLAFALLLRERLVDGRVLGFALFFLPVVVTWLADTAAYFAGRAFGRHPMAPVVSPNKTVEGGIAALLAGPAGALAIAHLAVPELVEIGTAGLVVTGTLIAAAAVFGDLAESAIKRECGVKDSSRLLPGHGGLLDRMDSLLWSFPVAYFCLVYYLG